MKTAIKLVLIYLGFQIAGAFAGALVGIIHSLVTSGNIDMSTVQQVSLAPSLLFGIIFMFVYLWKANYVSNEKVTWSPVSVRYILLSVILYAACLILIEYLMSFMQWLPDWMESSFETLQSGWLGILSVAVFGPVLEELLFRSAITKVLLEKYNPAKAIVISALIFGVFHLNPAQIVSATLIGLVFGWMYYKTASLIPCILIHILNNSLSVYLNINYPGIDTLQELVPGYSFYLLIGGALVTGLIAYKLMDKVTIHYNWKKEETPGDEIFEND